MPTPSPATARTGRRRRVVDACIDLVLAGHLPPSAEEVAARAGISMATLFRYFETLDELRRDAARRAEERFPGLHQVPDPGLGRRSDRIERFASRRVALWEQTHLLARLVRHTALQDAGAAEFVASSRRSMADQVRAHFQPELRGLTAAPRENTLLTIASLTSVETWEQFRSAGRSAAQIRRAWVAAIDRILPQA